MTPGKLIIISAPSGCGKSTIIGEIIKNPDLRLEFSISATTREPRRGEVDGVNYYFLTTEQFEKAIKNDELVEYEEVYAGRYYGTLKSEIARIQAEGKNVILDIDVKGGVNVKEKYGDVPVLCVTPFAANIYLKAAIASLRDRTLGMSRVYMAHSLGNLVSRDNDMGADGHPNYQGQCKIAMSLIPQISFIMNWNLKELF